jgi:hypothetical protein
MQTKHKKLYETVNKILDYLDEHYEPEDEFVGTIDSKSLNFVGASPSNKATKCTHHHTNGYKCGLPIPWESDYAAIWERYQENDFNYGHAKLQQDILELIRKIV